VHECPPPAREAALDDQRVPGGEEHLGDGGGVGEVDGAGDRERLTFVGHDQFGVAGARLDPHHAVADLPERDAGTDGLDGAGELETEDLVLPAVRVGVTALALQGVGAVDRGVGDPDEDLVRPGGRVGDLGDGEDLGSSVLGDDDGAHAPSVADQPAGSGAGRSPSTEISGLAAAPLAARAASRRDTTSSGDANTIDR
jgi:hypothetical protein